MEVDLTTHQGLWGDTHLRTLEGEEHELNLDEHDDRAWLSRRLAQLQANRQ